MTSPILLGSMRDFHAYRAGKFQAQRDAWMVSARNFKDRQSLMAVRESVQAARQRNHEYLQELADWRKVATK